MTQCFTILTTDANESMAPYHDRMPLLLAAEECDAWLSGQGREKFLGRIPFAVQAKAADV